MPRETIRDNRLREWLEKRNMSQKQLAERLGEKRSAMSHWVNGRRNPDVFTAVRIAKVLRCRVGAIWEAGE